MLSRSSQAVTPDQLDLLSGFEDSCSAAELSDILFDRTDWALLASMFLCLVKPLEGQISVEEVSSEASYCRATHVVSRTEREPDIRTCLYGRASVCESVCLCVCERARSCSNCCVSK